ncbi:MAG: RES family NAD+ phosphorylase [Cytophagales bacterium]|nr:RES family NAD+ phosphorylase [Cytophagales bacterium]
MIVYRLTNHRGLDGKGAAKQANNRWNNLGTRVVYCAGSAAVAKGEISRRTPLNLLPEGFELLLIEIPDDSVEDLEQLPERWDASPPGYGTKVVGDEFVQSQRKLALRVPSVYDKRSFNFLLNPLYPLFYRVKIVHSEPFYF